MSVPNPATATSATLAKADRLVEDDRVSELRSRTFEVVGDHDSYRVTVADHVHSCTCPAAGECSHMYAVAKVLRAERAPADPFSVFDRLPA